MTLTSPATEMKMGSTPIWCKMSKGDLPQATVQATAYPPDLKSLDPDHERRLLERINKQKVQ